MNNNKIYVIAEMACSHDGSLELARKIIDGAGEAGANAIQLQIWSLENVLAPSHHVYEIAKKIQLTQAQWKDMVDYTRKKYSTMDIIVCVYEHQSINFIESLGVDGYKLNSSDLSNPYVLDRVAATGKKINLSIGASTLEEIQNAVQRLKKQTKGQITLMYGYQNFPTTIADIHLNRMIEIGKLLNLPVGYQDHCDAQTRSAFWIPALASGMGASILEKHITHDRSLKGVDHESALNPDEFKVFVDMVRELEAAKGIAEAKPFSDDELKYRKFQKKSIVAARPMKAGEQLREADINFLRADKLGIAPDKVDKILNKKIKHDISMYQIIFEEDVS